MAAQLEEGERGAGVLASEAELAAATGGERVEQAAPLACGQAGPRWPKVGAGVGAGG